jgi:hypothetical protein
MTPSQIYTGQGLGPLSLWLPFRRQEGGGTSFLCFGLVVRGCCCASLGVVGASILKSFATHSHTGDNLHGGVSKLMSTCACRSFRSAAWSPRRSLELARFVSRRVAHPFLAGGARCFLWSKDVGLEVVDLSFFSNFVD